ncbi:MAG TPA: hypothetical protein DCR14_07280, partial [Acidimicrobiaceae bacterium]|nr:hypothetical protein [Acidimicrobiaceae bacterium]
ASAHSLASSAVTIELSEHGMTGDIALAVGSLDQAFDEAHRSDALTADAYAAQVTAYLDEHLTITGAGGTEWPEQYTDFDRQTVEGIETIRVGLTVDVAGDDPSEFTIAYDAIIEAVPGHEAVLVLVDATNSASTPGVFTDDEPTITIGDGSADVAISDMAWFGFHHVLDGADHLLFLLTLLLPAPLMAAAGRWRRGPGVSAAARKVLHVVTAFTVGHSLTLVATSLGWISVPSRPIEIMIAVSVGVSAIHAIRPLVRGGETLIAAGFGLVHGMAFAGILHDLGLNGKTSRIALFAFNVGIELAQVAVTACIFPSLYVMSTGRSYLWVRIGGAVISLATSLGWLADRTGLTTNPLAGVESIVIAQPWTVVGAIATFAGLMWLVDRRLDGLMTPRKVRQFESGDLPM